MILFLINWYKRREGLQFIFHCVSTLPIDNVVNQPHYLFVGFAPVEPLLDF